MTLSIISQKDAKCKEVGEQPLSMENDWIESVIGGIIPTTNNSTLHIKPTIVYAILDETTQSLI